MRPQMQFIPAPDGVPIEKLARVQRVEDICALCASTGPAFCSHTLLLSSSAILYCQTPLRQLHHAASTSSFSSIIC